MEAETRSARHWGLQTNWRQRLGPPCPASVISLGYTMDQRLWTREETEMEGVTKPALILEDARAWHTSSSLLPLLGFPGDLRWRGNSGYLWVTDVHIFLL